jgi:hypothetical protein
MVVTSHNRVRVRVSVGGLDPKSGGGAAGGAVSY